MTATRHLRYWGKAQTDQTYHPAVYHGLDVAACGLRLLRDNPALLRRMAALAGIDPDQLLMWTAYLLALHDIGKPSNGFQGQRRALMLLLQGLETEAPYGKAGLYHDSLGTWLWTDTIEPRLTGEGGPLSRDGVVGYHASCLLEPWLRPIFGHHGAPVPPRRQHGALRHQFPTHVVEDVYRYVLDLHDLFGIHELPFELPPRRSDARRQQRKRHARVSWILAGVAVAADWLGSDVRWFPHVQTEMSVETYWHTHALPKARRVLTASRLKPQPPANRSTLVHLTGQDWDCTPLQHLAETIHLERTPTLVVAEDATGAGKTESAIVLAHRMVRLGHADGIYMALHTMCTANAMFDRVEALHRRLFEGEATLVLVHSAAQLRQQEKFPDLPDHAWARDSRKKVLLAQLGVGTIDQALLAVLPVRHQSLRVLGLTRKVLIVDEVHAADSYTTQLLCRLLTLHASLGGSAILLSATLPQRLRGDLAAAYARGLDQTPPLLQSTDYPLLTQITTETTREIPVAPTPRSSRTVLFDVLHTVEDVHDDLRHAARRGCACWIRNTVPDAVEAYRHLRRTHGDRVLLAHSQLVLGDRGEVEREITQRFGPTSTAAERRGWIVVATQVLESSTDLDFDAMSSDATLIDLLLQRIGRLRRHLRDLLGNPCDGPDQRGQATLHVLMPDPDANIDKDWFRDVFPRAAYVYPHHGKLWRTLRWIADHRRIVIPDDLREVMEYVYGVDEWPQTLNVRERRAHEKDRIDVDLAAANALPIDAGYRAGNAPWCDDRYTPTRLGDPTITLRLARCCGDTWVPLYDHAYWELSELNVHVARVTRENPTDEGQLAALRRSMPDKGDHCRIALMHPDEEGYVGTMRNINDDAVTLRYDRRTGLSIEETT